MARRMPPGRNSQDAKRAEQERRLVELWLERPKTERTLEDLDKFYGWLSQHDPALIPSGAGSYKRLQSILSGHVVERSS